MPKGLLGDLLKYLPSQIVPGVIGFISIPIITRLFVPQDYGRYNLVMAAVMVLVTLLGWLPASIIRFYPSYERDNKVDVFVTSIIWLTFISIAVISLFAFATLYLIESHLAPTLYSLMWVGMGVFIVTGSFNVLQYFLRIKRRAYWFSFFAAWKSIGSLGLALLLIFFLRRDIESLLWGIVLCVITILPPLWKKAVGGVSNVYFRIDFFLTKEMAAYSFPLVVENLAVWVLSLSDRYVIEFFRETQEVGIYSAGYNITERSVMLIFSLFMMASGPISMHIWEKEGETKSKEFINAVTRYFLIVCIPMVVGLSVLSKPITELMTGGHYLQGYTIIPFVASGILLLGIQQQFNAGFLYYKKTVLLSCAVIASSILNLVLNIFFIPRFGYFAAAVTTFISYAFLLYITIFLSRRFFVWKFPFKSLIKVMTASLIMGIIVYCIENRLSSLFLLNLIVSIFSGIIVYSVLLFLFKEIQQGEKEKIYQYLKRCISI